MESVSVKQEGIRRVAGACFLAMQTGNSAYLLAQPSDEDLESSGLGATHANLCLDHGITIDRDKAMRGMWLSATNKRRWKALRQLLAELTTEGIDPVLFKGGALHARWPGMRDLRAMYDYDLMVPQQQIDGLRTALAGKGFEAPPAGSRFTQRLSKGWMVWKGEGINYQNLDIHARVTEPPVCRTLTASILASSERSDGIRIPDVEDCVCMIALHIVRSGMFRPLREYIDLMWYVDAMDETQWHALIERAKIHHLLPALFLSLRQARFCLALDELAPDRAATLAIRINALERSMGRLRRGALDWLAPASYPLQPVATRSHPLFRRSFILGAGTGSAWRVAIAFLMYGAARAGDRLSGVDQSRNDLD